jgi:hypothetical protein
MLGRLGQDIKAQRAQKVTDCAGLIPAKQLAPRLLRRFADSPRPVIDLKALFGSSASSPIDSALSRVCTGLSVAGSAAQKQF